MGGGGFQDDVAKVTENPAALFEAMKTANVHDLGFGKDGKELPTKKEEMQHTHKLTDYLRYVSNSRRSYSAHGRDMSCTPFSNQHPG